jgi:hypothetical protein
MPARPEAMWTRLCQAVDLEDDEVAALDVPAGVECGVGAGVAAIRDALEPDQSEAARAARKPAGDDRTASAEDRSNSGSDRRAAADDRQRRRDERRQPPD